MSLLGAVAFFVSIIGVWLTTTRSLWNYQYLLLSVLLYVAIFYQAKLYADVGFKTYSRSFFFMGCANGCGSATRLAISWSHTSAQRKSHAVLWQHRAVPEAVRDLMPTFF